MKIITINKVENGFVVAITYEGVQSMYDREVTLIANDKDELIELIKENA